MKNLKTILIWILMIFVSCEEASDISFSSADTNLIAVEAILTNENIRHEVKLTLPYQRINGQPSPVSGASVTLTTDENSISLEETSPGIFLTPQMRAVAGKMYTLTFSLNGQTYSAQDAAVAVEPLPEISFRSEAGGFILNFPESGQNANYIDHLLDWSSTPACTSDCNAKITSYDLKTIDVNELYKPSKEDFIFPARTTVTRKKYSVSPAYRAFLRSVLSETEWRGSVFDVNRDNAPTNFNQGVVGFFAVCMVVSDTTIVE